MIMKDVRSESGKVDDYLYVAMRDGDSIKVAKFMFVKANNPLKLTDDTIIRGYKWTYLKQTAMQSNYE